MSSDFLYYQYRPIVSDNTLFLDRDGVLIKTVERDGRFASARSWIEVELEPSIEYLSSKGMKDWNLVMITNQPDLSYGHISLKFLEDVNEFISKKIPLNLAIICPHLASDECDCRKPKTGLIRGFYKMYPSLTSARKVMIGDTVLDYGCARALGIPFILMKREYNNDIELNNEFISGINDFTELENIL